MYFQCVFLSTKCGDIAYSDIVFTGGSAVVPAHHGGVSVIQWAHVGESWRVNRTYHLPHLKWAHGHSSRRQWRNGGHELLAPKVQCYTLVMQRPPPCFEPSFIYLFVDLDSPPEWRRYSRRHNALVEHMGRQPWLCIFPLWQIIWIYSISLVYGPSLQAQRPSRDSCGDLFV